METLPLYLLLGAAAGFLAGLMGIGGGLIIVPALVFIFQAQGMADTLVMHMAIGTSLATIVLTAIASVRAHHQRGAVLWPVVWQLAPGIVAGALAGAALVDELPAAILKRIFGLFVLMVALQMALNARPAPHRQLPGRAGMTAAGSIIGGISAIVGIGGGTLTVPFLTWCRVGMHNAVATSAACGLPIALAGSVGFAVTGWNEANLPALSSGYLYWPAILSITASSVVFAPLGARLAHALPADLLKRVFAVVLALIGVRMVAG
ncbi:MAG: sulfite exporter TauE/SafE family protein [Gammaproteobacteria bacterium]|nr:sulfite exporter TauE/SafE family protein [Gammaproteobacteria bacterium]